MLGATGYVGGRLVPRLLEAGHDVRCLARDPAKLRDAAWADRTQIVDGDLLAPETLHGAFADIDVVYHLVHSMGGGRDFAGRDRRIAATVARAAADAGVGRMVYLGGLSSDAGQASEHMRSRAEVADVLRAGAVPVTELRAAVIIGSGSASFEMLRNLVEVLPVMVTPRWVESRVQPIAIRDVLRYLIGVLVVDDDKSHIYDIGGPDVLTYRQMMRLYAEVAQLPHRIIVGVPLLTPRLSSHWVGLVTPVPAAIAKPLVDSLVVDAVADDGTTAIERLVPGARIDYRTALHLALARVRDHDVETSWREADLTDRGPAEPEPGDPAWSGGTLYADVRTARSSAPALEVFRAVCGVGGDRGWPSHNWAWRIRGVLDRAIGGIGLRRGRRDPDTLRVGDALDFWRVVAVRAPDGDQPGVLRLFAEMRLPGKACLEFHIVPTERGSVLRQRALFAPKGLLGRLYWWAVVPFHGMIFPTMVTTLARRAEVGATSTGVPTGPPWGRDGVPAAADRGRRRARRAG
ncbi:MAG: SDR family oxidoreductase [Actinobacteria bacterium]|nr:SDR family oxidoreductase [Actinomycetota bacterium]